MRFGEECPYITPCGFCSRQEKECVRRTGTGKGEGDPAEQEPEIPTTEDGTEPDGGKKEDGDRGGTLEKDKSGRKIDTGKILALYNAKWSVKNIAIEMGCSDQTVRNVLRENVKKKAVE